MVCAEPNEKAVKTAYVLEIDFGTLGLKTSSAQILVNYRREDLMGKQVLAVLDSPLNKRKHIADIRSDCLLLVAACSEKCMVLIWPDFSV
ncbi:MAG: tRNA-binding protein [Flavobacteriales bacterium]